MSGDARGSVQRSNLYSAQRFTNWRPDDPYWSEIETLAAKMRPRAEVVRDGEDPLGIFDRPLAKGFVRPWSVDDVKGVLDAVPGQYLSELTGVFLLGGTSRQRRLKKITYGMYAENRIFLFAVPEQSLTQTWSDVPDPSTAQEYTKYGATFAPLGRGRTMLKFNGESLRRFFLYDVLLHEIGHHADRQRRAASAERYARWFAEFQRARLGEV